MADPRTRFPGPPLRERLLAARGVLAAAGLVLLGFVTIGVLSWFHALLGFAVIAAAAIVGRGVSVPPRAGRAPEGPGAGMTDSWIESLIGKLPDPVIVLYRDGRVVAFNARATSLAAPSPTKSTAPRAAKKVRSSRSSSSSIAIQPQPLKSSPAPCRITIAP